MKRTAKLVVLGMMVLGVALGVVEPVDAARDVQDFTINTFEADYYLSRTQQKASKMRVEEKIVADFPAYNQNHGIERALPKVYDGHSLQLDVLSVTDANGKARPYTERSHNDQQILRIGDPDTFVHGQQEYNITYTYQNVTKNFETHDELFWDTNGTQWQQPIQQLVARVHVGRDIAEALDGREACFLGEQGSNERCAAQITNNSDGGKTITFEAHRRLGPGENLSFVVGFANGTFAQYVKTAEERARDFLLAAAAVGWVAATVIIPVVMVFVLIRVWRRYGRAPQGRGTIVPEYLPPKNASVLLSAQVAKSSRHAITAQIIDFAVRHYVKIYEVKSKKLFRKKTFELEVIKSPETLRDDERQLFEVVFGARPTIGTRINLDKIARKRYREMNTLSKRMRKQSETSGYFVRHRNKQIKYYVIGAIIIVLGAITFSPTILLTGIATLIVASSLRPRTARGVKLLEYLEGLKMYLKLAEKERIKVLQSPSGAEKVKIDDKKQLIKLYERLLPYAVLLGVEKEWGEQFTQLSEAAPEWYVGSSPTFNAVVFTGAIASFTSVSSSAFSTPTNSSSSGFSGGGGTSGGGGGGGGGGGW